MKKNFLLGMMLACVMQITQADDKTLDISYVKSPFNLPLMVMKERQLLEKAVAPLGVSVRWHEINSGSKQAQALASGDLDIAGVINSSSVLMANGEGNAVWVIAGVSRPTDTFALVAGQDGVASVAELKGKKVAGPKGTVLHQMLVAALQREGIALQDVEFVQMDIPQAFAALQGGQIDAALLAANTLIKAQEAGGKVLTTAQGLVVPKLVMAASDKAIAAYPEWMDAAVRAQEEASVWMAGNLAEAIALGAREQGISEAQARQLYGWSHFTLLLNEADMQSMEDDMRFMRENGMMRHDVDVRAIVLPRALEAK